jgi:hypothetical protein
VKKKELAKLFQEESNSKNVKKKLSLKKNQTARESKIHIIFLKSI